MTLEFIKQPYDMRAGAELDFKFPWTKWLAGAGIASLVPLPGPGVTVLNSKEEGGEVTVMIQLAESLAEGFHTWIDCKIRTDETPPRVDTRRIRLRVIAS